MWPLNCYWHLVNKWTTNPNTTGLTMYTNTHQHVAINKVSIIMLLCTWHEDMEKWRAAPSFATSALDKGKRQPNAPDPLPRGKRSRCTHGIGGWIGPGASLEALKNIKIRCRYRKSNTTNTVPVNTRYIRRVTSGNGNLITAPASLQLCRSSSKVTVVRNREQNVLQYVLSQGAGVLDSAGVLLIRLCICLNTYVNE